LSAEGNFNIAVGNWGKTTKAAAGEMKRKASWLGWDGTEEAARPDWDWI